MTNLYAFDAAYAPNLAKVKAAGGIAINGYLTGIYSSSTTQPAAARKAGLGYVATYEEGPSELVRATRATGRRVGDKIVAAFKAKGLPLDGTIAVYPSVDVTVPIDGNDRDADQCNTGWQGIRDVIDGDISIRSYAEGAIIDALASAKLVDGKCWLAAPTSWPGFNVNDKNICMVQLVGTNVPGTDKNHLVTDPHALGAWWPTGSPYATQGELMMDPDVKAAFAAITASQAAINRQLAALPKAVWNVPFVNPNDTKTTYTAASWLVNGNLKAGRALVAATAAGKAAAIDAAAVAADIKTRLLALLGGTQ